MIEWYKKVVFENYANFEGRARRSEYWYFTLANLLIVMVFVISGAIFMGTEMEAIGTVFFVLAAIYVLATIVPNLAVTVRRLHDINKSGWYYLVSWIPYIGGVWLLILTCTNGTVGTNNYGPDPKNPFDEIDEIGQSETI